MNICKDKAENNQIFELMDWIKSKGNSIFHQFEFDNDVLDLSLSQNITATLLYVDSLSRIIICKVPIKYYSGEGLILKSAKALFWAVGQKIGDKSKELLIKSIERMMEMYNSDYSITSFKDMAYVPNQAFLESF